MQAFDFPLQGVAFAPKNIIKHFLVNSEQNCRQRVQPMKRAFDYIKISKQQIATIAADQSLCAELETVISGAL